MNRTAFENIFKFPAWCEPAIVQEFTVSDDVRDEGRKGNQHIYVDVFFPRSVGGEHLLTKQLPIEINGIHGYLHGGFRHHRESTRLSFRGTFAVGKWDRAALLEGGEW